MEFTTSYTNHNDLAEATKGIHGKEVGKDYTIVCVENLIIGIAANTDILDKKVTSQHYEWKQIGNGVYLSVLK